MTLRFTAVVVFVSLFVECVSSEWTEQEFGIFEQKLTELADQYFPFDEDLPDQNNSEFNGKFETFISRLFFCKNGPTPASFVVNFRHFHMAQFKYKLIKA